MLPHFVDILVDDLLKVKTFSKIYYIIESLKYQLLYSDFFVFKSIFIFFFVFVDYSYSKLGERGKSNVVRKQLL
jgi:hypothetical protein